MVFSGFLASLSWKHLAIWVRGVSLSACAALVVLVGPSRIILGEHWVCDAIGGYVIGAFWLIVLIVLYEVAVRRLRGDEENTGSGGRCEGPDSNR